MTGADVGRLVDLASIDPWLRDLSAERGYVYGLTDPRRRPMNIAYIGQTTNLIRRFLDHMDPGSPKSDERRVWVRTITDAGAVPGLVVLERPKKDSRSLLTAESWWIVHLKTLGLGWVNRLFVEPDVPVASDVEQRVMELIASAATKHRDEKETEARQLRRVVSQGANERRRKLTAEARAVAEVEILKAAERRRVREENAERRSRRQLEEAKLRMSESEFERRVMVKAQDLLSGIEQRYRNAAVNGGLRPHPRELNGTLNG